MIIFQRVNDCRLSWNYPAERFVHRDDLETFGSLKRSAVRCRNYINIAVAVPYDYGIVIRYNAEH